MTKTSTVARFHFDPAHDPSCVPDMDRFLEWIRAEMMGKSDDGLPGAFRLYERSDERRTLPAAAWSLLPKGRREARRKVEDECLAAAMPEIERIHDLMREYAIDLTLNRFADVLQSMISIVMIDRRLENLVASLPEEMRPAADARTTADRLRPYWTDMKEDLQAEALLALLDKTRPRSEWPMIIASLRSAREELGSEDLRASVVALIEEMEGALSR